MYDKMPPSKYSGTRNGGLLFDGDELDDVGMIP